MPTSSKAVSPLIAMVFTIMFGVTMLIVVMNVVNPMFRRAQDTSVVTDAFQNLEMLNTAIESVASEAQGSTRTVPLSVSGGTYRVNSTYDWLYFEYEPSERMELSGQKGNVYVRHGLQFADWFDSYADGSASSAGWTNMSGTWSFSDYKYSGANGTSYHNISGPLEDWKFSATIANFSGAAGGEAFVLPTNPESLVGYWAGDETTGNTFYDWSGHGNTGAFSGNVNGTLTNMNTTGNATSGWTTECKYESCLKFDGVNDYVDLGNKEAWNFSSSFTFSFWVKKFDTTGAKDMLFKGDSTTRSWQIRTIATSGKLYFPIWNSDGTPFELFANTVLLNDTWYQVTGLYNSTHIRLFLNGIEDSTPKAVVGAIRNTTGILAIGRAGSTSSEYFNGTIDDVKIWSRVLSADEIILEYNGIRSGEALNSNTNTTGLVGWWKFNEGSGSSAADDSMRAYGQYAGAMKFDGVNDSVLASKSTGIVNSFTAALWFKRAGPSGGYGDATYHTLIQSISGNSPWTRILLTSAGSTIMLQQKNSTGDTLSPTWGSQPFWDNNWHHVAYVFNGSHIHLYIDGTLQGSPYFSSGVTTGTTSPRIGAYDGIGQYYVANGTVDELMVFNRSLSADEIKALYETSMKKISGVGGSQSVGVKTPTPAIVLSNPSGTTKFDSVEVTDISSKLTLLIPYSGTDINGTLRAAKGEHQVEVRNMGVSATTGRPVIQLTAS